MRRTHSQTVEEGSRRSVAIASATGRRQSKPMTRSPADLRVGPPPNSPRWPPLRAPRVPPFQLLLKTALLDSGCVRGESFSNRLSIPGAVACTCGKPGSNRALSPQSNPCSFHPRRANHVSVAVQSSPHPPRSALRIVFVRNFSKCPVTPANAFKL